MKKLFKLRFFEFLRGLTLLVVSIFLGTFFSALAFIYSLIYCLVTFKIQTALNELGSWMLKMAVSIDQFGNVSGAMVMNKVLIKKNGIKFGHEDDTISYILARNKYHRTLTVAGKILGSILNLIDRNHLEKAIEAKIISDEDAVLRIQKDEYYE